MENNNKTLKDYIKKSLIRDGVVEKTAENILSGSQPMNKLDRAIRLSREPYYISIEIWEDLYKKG